MSKSIPVFRSLRSRSLIQLLKNGAVGVLPTDTLYGIVAQAGNKEAVERVYALRKRSPGKPCIVLISSIGDLSQFSIRPSQRMREALLCLWPGPVSIILPCSAKKFEYLHRGTKTLALRMPKAASLRSLLAQTGPLIAPSANPEGERPAYTIAPARKYFGSAIDFMVDCGNKVSAPSSVIGIHGRSITVLRGGEKFKI